VVAEAFFARAALANHSCSPNTALQFSGRTLELRATAGLPPGCEVRTCYGAEAGFAPVSERQATLRSLYYFECDCAACTRELSCARMSSGLTSEGKIANAAAAYYAQAQRLDGQARDLCEVGRYAEAAEHVEIALGLLRHVFASGRCATHARRPTPNALPFCACAPWSALAGSLSITYNAIRVCSSLGVSAQCSHMRRQSLLDCDSMFIRMVRRVLHLL
jgi:hypothetical protein